MNTNILFQWITVALFLMFFSLILISTPAQAQSAPQNTQPNIIVIMGDDVGWFNIGAYNQYPTSLG